MYKDVTLIDVGYSSKFKINLKTLDTKMDFN